MSNIAMDTNVAVKLWTCSKLSYEVQRRCWLLNVCPHGADRIHTHCRGCRIMRVHAQWSASGHLIINAFCCKPYLSIWAMIASILPPWCLIWSTNRVCFERYLWRPLCLHSTSTEICQPLDHCPVVLSPSASLWANCCASSAVLLVQRGYKGRQSSCTKTKPLVLGRHWATWYFSVASHLNYGCMMSRFKYSTFILSSVNGDLNICMWDVSLCSLVSTDKKWYNSFRIRVWWKNPLMYCLDVLCVCWPWITRHGWHPAHVRRRPLVYLRFEITSLCSCTIYIKQ